MSVVLLPASETQGGAANLRSTTTLGDGKPLHRFVRGQPKINGIVLLFFGSSFILLSIPMAGVSSYQITEVIPPCFWLGPLVTISLALSIVALLVAVWVSLIVILPNAMEKYFHMRNFWLYNDDRVELHWEDTYEVMAFIIYGIFELLILIGASIRIVMSLLAGISLRSTKSKAQVVITMPTT